MKRFLISAAAAALLAGTALAADLPVYEPPPIVETAPVGYSWSGFYVGINGGYGWENDDGQNFVITEPPFAPPGPFFGPCTVAGTCPTGINNDVDGFLVGGHAGFNWQANWVVFGVEADIDYSDMEGTGTVNLTNAGTGFVPFASSVTTDYDFFGTFRGRLGAAFDRVLVYGTGGLAYADIEDSASFGFPGFPTLATEQVYRGSEDDVEFGWTAGGGVEVAVTDNVSFGAEALYFDLGDRNVDLNAAPGAAVPAAADVDINFEHTGVIARGRLSVKFGSLFGG